jgi:hypothetical protein
MLVNVINVDRLAAQYGQEVICALSKVVKASEVDNIVTKALGVLQENGVYACFLYLLAKKEKPGTVIIDKMLALMDKLGFKWNGPDKKDAGKILKFLTDKVTVEMEPLLLVKETLEKMLIYARYGAKARK